MGPYLSNIVRIEKLFHYFQHDFTTFIYSSNPWDMTKERNVIITVVIQACCAAPIIVYFILIPQFLFLAINRYFSIFIEDVKMIIKKFDKKEKNVNLKANFIEMVNLHSRSLQ